MKDNEMILLLLQLIRVNGNTMYLIEHGYTLHDLMQAIDTLKKDGLVCVNDKGGLSTNNKGELFFYKLNRRLGRKGIYRYLGKHKAFNHELMPLDAIYVPLNKIKDSRIN